MAIEKVTVIKVDTGEAQTSVKDLRNELKRMKDMMFQCEEGTDEYNEALARAAEIQHDLKEQMELVNASAMDFGQIAQNTTKLVGGMVAGLQAAKATMNLFGVENEDVIKSLQKMQNLMALTQALPALDAGYKAFQRLSSAIATATGATTKLKRALISTGLGAAIVAVGLLAANWDKVVAALREWGILHQTTQEKLEEQRKKVDDLKTKLEEAKQAYDDWAKEMKEKKLSGPGKKEYDELTNAIKGYKLALNKIEAEKALAKTREEWEKLNEEGLKYLDMLVQAEKRQNELLNSATGNAGTTKSSQDRMKDRLELIEREKQAEEYSLRSRIKGYEEFQREKTLLDIRYWEKMRATMEEERNKELEASRGVITKTLAWYTEELNVLDARIRTAQSSLMQSVASYISSRGRHNKEEEKSEKDLTAAYMEEWNKRKSIIQEEATIENIYLNRADTDWKTYAERRYEIRMQELGKELIAIRDMRESELEITEEADRRLLEEERRILEQLHAMREAYYRKDMQELMDGLTVSLDTAAAALNEFADNPAWGNILTKIADLTANWEQLNLQIEQGGAKAIGAYLSMAATGFAVLGQMMNGLADEQDASNREGFESQKNLQAAGAGMNMMAGIVSSWASSMQLPFPFNIVVGTLLSGMMLGVGIAQINKIKNQQFDDGGNSAGAGGTALNTGSVSSLIAPVQYTKDVQGADIEGSIKNSRVYVTETDISDTQNRVRVTENEARY